MANLEARIRRMIDGLPQGASITLSRSTLEGWIDDETESGAPARAREPVADLTVEEIAEAHGKAESTIRGWLQDVPGTYRLGNELRVPREAWREYLDGLSENGAGERPKVRSKRSADLRSWRGGDS